jgi:transcriptional regulator with XRE-family HTH domain
VLGAQLRRLREAADISRADAGYAIRSSDSKVSRLELGRVAFKERDVSDLLTMYGITDPGERDAFLDMVRQANEPGWWRRYSDVMPAWFHDFVGLEESASRIQTYELQFVPGLLQTEAYARSIATRGRPEYASDDAERRVTLRMRRQKILTGMNPPKLWVVLDESVLHRPIGGRAVLRAQLEQLLELSKLSNITVQIVPNHLSGYAAEGSFTSNISAGPSTSIGRRRSSCTAGRSTDSRSTRIPPTDRARSWRKRWRRSDRKRLFLLRKDGTRRAPHRRGMPAIRRG